MALRFSNIKSELDFELDFGNMPVVRTNPNFSDNPVKTVVGVKFCFETESRWSAHVLTSVGASLFSGVTHFSFRVAPEATYAVSETIGLTLGYQYSHLNYERGNNIVLTQNQHALTLGVRVGM